jgi:leader peptidase (prepilin peptidase) / N-methyltransferase
MIADLAAAWPLLFPFAAGLLGLLVGSFLNVVIYRLPKMMEAAWRRECREFLQLEATDESGDERLDLALPASHCPNCQAPIRAIHNIPLLSYLMLRGRCASCGAAIGLRYPLIELTAGVLGFLSIWWFGATPLGIAAVLFCWALLALTVIDIDHQLLPDQITLPLLWAGLLVNAVGGFVSLSDAVWGAAAGYLILWTVYWVFKLLTGKEGMGYGDFKLLGAMGAWLGWQFLPLIILLSSLVGAVCGGILLYASRRGSQVPIPFGPYLAGAGLITLFWGEQLVRGYLQFAGF